MRFLRATTNSSRLSSAPMVLAAGQVRPGSSRSSKRFSFFRTPAHMRLTQLHHHLLEVFRRLVRMSVCSPTGLQESITPRCAFREAKHPVSLQLVTKTKGRHCLKSETNMIRISLNTVLAFMACIFLQHFHK